MDSTSTSLVDFRLLQKLGEGAFSTVYMVIRKTDQQEYALKKVAISSINERERANALNEIRILASINNLYIIDYKEAFFDEGSQSLCIILEYAREGDLHKKIESLKKQGKYFSEKEIWKCLMHLSKGLGALHDLQIFHRDLKSANVFLCKDLYKLGDLNVSKVVDRGSMAKTQTGTPYYASPEVWRECPYDLKSDIWSLGCVIYEMAALLPPFRAGDMQGLFNKVQKGIFDRIPPIYSNELQKVITGCLQINPLHRPTCSKIQQDIMQYGILERSEVQDEKANIEIELMKTIEIPKLWRAVKLPSARYGGRSVSPPKRGDQGRIVSAGINRNPPAVVRFPSSYQNESQIVKPEQGYINNPLENKKIMAPFYSPLGGNQNPPEPLGHQKPEFLRNARRNLILDNYNKSKDIPKLSPIVEGVIMSNNELRENIGSIGVHLKNEPNSNPGSGRIINKFKKFGQEESSPHRNTDLRMNFNNVRLATGQSILQENKMMSISRPLWWG